MEESFWNERWKSKKIGFHLTEVNPILIKNISCLIKEADSAVLVPMCGKSLDLIYLQSKGLNVIGFEIDKSAVDSFFTENNIDFTQVVEQGYLCYRTSGLTIFVGDYLKFPSSLLQNIDVTSIYDRAALVALPIDMRQKYYKKMSEFYPSGANVLCVTFDYDDTKTSGPPFSIPMDELEAFLAADFEIKILDEYVGNTKNPRLNKEGSSNVVERVLLLRRK